jgi:hypothetical protein
VACYRRMMCRSNAASMNGLSCDRQTRAESANALLPDAGRHFLSKDESAKATNYLEDEIRQRVGRGAVRFKVVLQLAAPGDKIDDPSVGEHQ